MFSKDDLQQLKERGSDPTLIKEQLVRFSKGFPYTQLVRPATPGDGIRTYSDEEKKELASLFDMQKMEDDIARFVPASGAATRMFKALFEILEKLKDKGPAEQEAFVKRDHDAKSFFDALGDYPFYADLELTGDELPAEILEKLLTGQGLNYGELPKGLLKFHRYTDERRTAFEEHLHEAAIIARPKKNVNLHFTVSAEHLDGFRELESRLVPGLEKKYGVQFSISYSFQKKETDTIAVDLENKPFRDEQGKLVFRPGGHGALLHNLDRVESNVVFINNIDNVSHDGNSSTRVLHKKMLGGALIRARQEIFSIQKKLQERKSRDNLKRAEAWITGEANEALPAWYEESDVERRGEWLLRMLDRPVRVCGMVRNEGDPGGGPFFTKDSSGKVSLQIVETSQVDMDDEDQVARLKDSTHFNPVDIVCSTRSANGSYFDLADYVDHDTGFISLKSMKGRDLKALELPGLWNGSMAGWNTIFIEVPGATFSPVKTVFDLLNPGHADRNISK